MLRFVTHADHQLTLRPYAERWAGDIGRRIEIVSYDELFRSTRVPACVHVFTDLERLSDDDAERAAYVWAAIREEAPDIKLLNHPIRGMRRYELLRTLYEKGINRFDVYRLTEARRPVSFPVFVRNENDHAGPETGLLRSQAELDAAVDSLARAGKSRGSRIVVEFCAEPSTSNVFRKYAAFCLDGEIVARHLMLSRDWMIKASTRLLGEAEREEERVYVRGNPDSEWVRRVFEIARIDYGRIDYGVVGGHPQVYEINTNPTIVPAEAVQISPTSAWFAGEFAKRLASLEATALPTGSREWIRLKRPLKSVGARLGSAVLQKITGRQLRRSI